MRKVLGPLGFIIALMGVSGALDHLWRQPVMGAVLNILNREIFEKVDWIAAHGLFANLIVAVLGTALIVLSNRR